MIIIIVQAERLQSQYGIYNRIGRVPLVALPPKDIEYSAQAIYEVINDKNWLINFYYE